MLDLGKDHLIATLYLSSFTEHSYRNYRTLEQKSNKSNPLRKAASTYKFFRVLIASPTIPFFTGRAAAPVRSLIFFKFTFTCRTHIRIDVRLHLEDNGLKNAGTQTGGKAKQIEMICHVDG